MKQSIIFAAFWVIMMPFESLAQRYYYQGYPFENHHIYGGLTATLPIGGGFSGTYFHPSGFGASISFITFSTKGSQTPSNFDNGSYLFNWFGLLASYPKDQVQCYALHAIKEFPTDGNRIRFGIEAGPSVLKVNMADNFIPVDDPCPTIFGCGPNYSYEMKPFQAVGLSMKGKLEWTIGKPFGLEFVTQANLNNIKPFIIAGFTMDFGIVRAADGY